MKYTYCLICKTTDNLTRHHVIPTSITKHLNYQHKLEDIVCLCEKCHKSYHTSLNSQLPKIYTELKFKCDSEKIRRKITALQKNLPIKTRAEYLEEIKQQFPDFTENNLDYYLQICINNRTKVSEYKYLADTIDISVLEQVFRNNFNKYVSKRIKK